MRAAPPVVAALDAGRRERMLIALLHVLAGLSLGAWLALHAGWPLALAMPAAAVLMAALGFWLAARALPADAGSLCWDGQCWRCAGVGEISLQRVIVALDLGLWVLLQLHPAGGGRRLWRVASARGAQASWHGLRLALAAHAGAAAEPRAAA